MPLAPDILYGIRDYWVRYLARQNHQVFAVLDAARDPKVIPMVGDSGGYASLFEGEGLADVAPYLVEVRADRLARLIHASWGRAWGVILTSGYPLRTVLPHLQRLLEVTTADGSPYLFRFYDPRVLRAVVPVCTADELDELLGPIDRYVIEARKLSAAIEVARRNGTATYAAIGVA